MLGGHLFSHAARTSCLVVRSALEIDIGILLNRYARFNTISGSDDRRQILPGQCRQYGYYVKVGWGKQGQKWKACERAIFLRDHNSVPLTSGALLQSVCTHFNCTALIRWLTGMRIKHRICQLVSLFIVHGNEKLSRLYRLCNEGPCFQMTTL